MPASWLCRHKTRHAGGQSGCQSASRRANAAPRLRSSSRSSRVSRQASSQAVQRCADGRSSFSHARYSRANRGRSTVKSSVPSAAAASVQKRRHRVPSLLRLPIPDLATSYSRRPAGCCWPAASTAGVFPALAFSDCARDDDDRGHDRDYDRGCGRGFRWRRRRLPVQTADARK